MQSQALRHDSYKTLTQAIFEQVITPYFYKHAIINPWDNWNQITFLFESDLHPSVLIAL